MKGTVDKIWENQTKGKKMYHVLEIGGEKYSVWEEKLMEGLGEGNEVEYEWAKSGDFRKITDLRKIQTGPGPDPYERDRKSVDIIRMSCLKSASEILYGLFIDPDEKTEKAIEISKRFEKYVTDEGGNEG